MSSLQEICVVEQGSAAHERPEIAQAWNYPVGSARTFIVVN